MLNLFKTLVGGGAFSASPVSTGVTFLKSELRKAGHDPDSLPDRLLRDLAEDAKRFSEVMAEMLPDDKPVTYFVQRLEYVAGALCDLLSGTPINVDEGIAEMLTKHRLSFTRASR